MSQWMRDAEKEVALAEMVAGVVKKLIVRVGDTRLLRNVQPTRDEGIVSDMVTKKGIKSHEDKSGCISMMDATYLKACASRVALLLLGALSS